MSAESRRLYACLYRPPTQPQSAVPVPSSLPHPQSLVQIAHDFSPRYETHRDDLVTVDISGLERLLGPPRVIADELRRDASERGLRLHIAIAGTWTAAMVLALSQPGVTVAERGTEADALAPIPIAILNNVQVSNVESQLETTSSRLQTFLNWGIKTLGELAALPAADLVARLGPASLAWQTMARGDDVRPLSPSLPEERFESTLELEWPIEGLEPLSFVLTRLLEPLSMRLERRDRGAAVLHILLGLVSRDATGLGRASHARRLELPAPMRDVRALRTLALLDLESHPPDAAIDRVTVVIDPTPGRVLQHRLFARAHPTPEQLSTLLARLGALMGQDRVGAPATVDTFRPGAFEVRAFATEHSDARATLRTRRAHGSRPDTLERDRGRPALDTREGDGPSASPRGGGVARQSVGLHGSEHVVSALRRCRHPVPARVAVAGGRPVRVTTDRRGFAGGAVVQCAGPWRSSGNWWSACGEPSRAGGSGESGRSGKSCGSGRESHQPHQTYPAHQPHQTYPAHQPYWSRDEWDVALHDGAVYRVFRDRDTDGWFVEGIVD